MTEKSGTYTIVHGKIVPDEQQQEFCEWNWNRSGCGYLTKADPDYDYGMAWKFCPFCGKPLKAVNDDRD